LKKRLGILVLLTLFLGACATYPGESSVDIYPLFRFGPTYQVLMKECVLYPAEYDKETAEWLKDHAILPPQDVDSMPGAMKDFISVALGNAKWLKENCK